VYNQSWHLADSSIISAATKTTKRVDVANYSSSGSDSGSGSGSSSSIDDVMEKERHNNQIISKELESGTGHTISPTTKPPTVDPFKEQPQCSIMTMEALEDTSMRNILEKFGKYVPVPSSSNEDFRRPRYDHVSCFFMKPRYNCAIPPSPRNSSDNNNNKSAAIATDFMLVLENPLDISNNSNINNYSSYCDLQKFVRDAGGPAGIARQLVNNQKEKGIPTGNNGNGQQQQYIDVLLLGTSLLRQVFEALLCGFQDQISDLQLQLIPIKKKHHFIG